MSALEARDGSYRRCGRSLVQRVSLAADRGELLAVTGPPGSGAETVTRLLAGELRPDAGRVLVDGRQRSWPRSEVDPRAVAPSFEHAAAALRSAVRPKILVCGRIVGGVPLDQVHELLASCRRIADDGASVVVHVEDPMLAAAHATTIALFVAGRMLSWGVPAVALVPAVHMLGTSEQIGATAREGEHRAAHPTGRSEPHLRLVREAR